MNDFWKDDAWQKAKRDKYLTPFYGEYSQDSRYVYIEKSRCSTLLQKRLAVDTVLQSRHGGSLCIEEKIVRYKGKVLDRFALETDSCTVPGHESPGWMVYGEADYLFYCFETETLDLDCYIVRFLPLKEWFWQQDLEKYHRHIMSRRNRSATRLVPTTEVADAIGAKRFLLAPDGLKLDLDPMEARRALTHA